MSGHPIKKKEKKKDVTLRVNYWVYIDGIMRRFDTLMKEEVGFVMKKMNSNAPVANVDDR